MSARPPAAWRAALAWLVARDARGRVLLAELDEEFGDRVGRVGARGARRWYGRQARQVVLRYVLPRALRGATGARPRRDLFGGGAAWGAGPVELMRDLRSAGARLRRSPGYASAFVLTLGLGIGANTAVFSVVRGVLLAPLPYVEGDRIVQLSQGARGSASTSPRFSFVELGELRAQSRTLDAFAGFGASRFTVLGGSAPHRAAAGLVSGSYFELLGLRPARGRALVPADDARDAEPVAVLTHEYWTRVFGADPGVLDGTLRLGSGRALRIVGVLGPGPHYTGAHDLFVNFAASDHYVGAAMQEERSHRMTQLFARMAPGATPTEVSAELDGIAERFRRAEPEAYGERPLALHARSWRAVMTEQAGPRLWLLLVATGFVLLVACANVVGLTLARLWRRRRDLSVRAALGAGRAQLRWELLCETLVLSVAGGLVGLTVAVSATSLLTDYAARLTVRTEEIGLDATVFALTCAVAVLVALAAAFVPRLHGPTQGGILASGTATRGTLARSERGGQKALVVSQLALSFVLVTGAVGFSRSFQAAVQVDLGLETDRVLTLRTYEATAELGRGNRSGPTSDDARVFTARLLQELEAHPAISAAAVAGSPPLLRGPGAPRDFRVEGADAVVRSEATVWAVVSPGYFRALDVAVLGGRPLAESDGVETEAVVVINESMARDLFAARDPVGRRIHTAGGTVERAYRVVGVVADTRASGLEAGVVHELYQSWRQGPPYPPSTLLVRTDQDPLAVAAWVRATIRALDPTRAIDEVRPLEAVRADVLGPQRLNATLMTAFALLALTIAGVGVFGILALSVTRRTRELGVRVALGARSWRLGAQVVREGVALACAGLAVGAASLTLIAGILRDEPALAGAVPTRPTDFVWVVLALLLAALVSASVPVARVLRMAPTRSISAE